MYTSTTNQIRQNNPTLLAHKTKTTSQHIQQSAGGLYIKLDYLGHKIIILNSEYQAQ